MDLPDLPDLPLPTSRRLALVAGAATLLAGCAGFTGAEPLKVNVVGLESLPGEGMELRFLVKLRLQNPGDASIDFDGVALDLDLRGQSFASGVSAERGSLARFGELLIAVPVTVSATAMLRQALSLMRDSSGQRLRIDYVARGRLGGGLLGSRRFESSGEVEWPPAPASTRP